MGENFEITPSKLIDLCDSVAENVITLRENVQSLEQLSKQLGTLKDNSFLRLEINQIRNKINDDLASVTTDMKTLKSTNDPRDQIVDLRTRTFEEIVLDTIEKYNVLVKKITRKERESILTSISISSDEYRPVSIRSSSNLQRASHMLTNFKLEEQNLLMKQQRILDMHKEIADTNEIMNLLSHMVDEQKNSVDRVATLIEDIAEDIETGNKKLETVEIKVVNSRNKTMLISFILIIVTLTVVALYFIYK